MSTWTRPAPYVFKINVSSSSNRLMSLGSIGCVMRNISGYWLDAYYGIVPFQSDIATDLKAIFYGFKLADEQDIGCIEIESDSETAVNHVLHPNDLFEHADIVQDIRSLMCAPWDSCVLKFVPQSSNHLAIGLANYALDEGCQVRSLWVCPGVLMPTMTDDWIASL